MMNIYEYIEQHPNRASAIIGLNYEVWQALVKQIQSSQAKSTTAMAAEKNVDVEISNLNCKPPLLPFRQKKATNPDATVATPRIPNCPQSLMQTAS